jgi:hypothetical protein
MRRSEAQLASIVQELVDALEIDRSRLRVAEAKRTLAVYDEAARWRPLLAWAVNNIELSNGHLDSDETLATAKRMLEPEEIF